MAIIHKVAIGLAITVASVYGWEFLRLRRSNAAALAERVLKTEDREQRQAAAVRLADAGTDALPYLQRLLQEDSDPGVRATCAEALGDQRDYESVELLLKSLEDPSPLVRARAAKALSQLFRRSLRFPTGGGPEARGEAVKQIRQMWKDLSEWSVVEHLKNGTPLIYYYDRNTRKLFEAPAASPEPMSTPSGSYKGMPAGFRAQVFAHGQREDREQERVLGYLSLPASEARKYALLPSGVVPPPGEDPDPLLLCRPEDDRWVYANSPEGIAMKAAAIKQEGGKGLVWPCQPTRW